MGIEAAIVLIAFVIVASALSFVVLNMGFSTTQKSKASVENGLAQASGSLQISGVSEGSASTASSKLNVTAFPIATAQIDGATNVDPKFTVVRYFSNAGVQYDNIYACALNMTTPQTSLSGAVTNAVANPACSAGGITMNPFTGGQPTTTKAFVYWTVQINANRIIEGGEQAMVAIIYKQTAPEDRPGVGDIIKTELVPPSGSVLTIQRSIPAISSSVVDLG